MRCVCEDKQRERARTAAFPSQLQTRSRNSKNSTISTAQRYVPFLFLIFLLFVLISSNPLLVILSPPAPCRLNPSRQRLLLLPTPHENHPLSTSTEVPTSTPLTTMLWSATTIPPFPVTPTSTPTLTPPQLLIPNDSITNTTTTTTTTIPTYLPAVLLLQPPNNQIAPIILSI